MEKQVPYGNRPVPHADTIQALFGANSNIRPVAWQSNGIAWDFATKVVTGDMTLTCTETVTCTPVSTWGDLKNAIARGYCNIRLAADLAKGVDVLELKDLITTTPVTINIFGDGHTIKAAYDSSTGSVSKNSLIRVYEGMTLNLRNLTIDCMAGNRTAVRSLNGHLRMEDVTVTGIDNAVLFCGDKADSKNSSLTILGCTLTAYENTTKAKFLTAVLCRNYHTETGKFGYSYADMLIADSTINEGSLPYMNSDNQGIKNQSMQDSIIVKNCKVRTTIYENRNVGGDGSTAGIGG